MRACRLDRELYQERHFTEAAKGLTAAVRIDGRGLVVWLPDQSAGQGARQHLCDVLTLATRRALEEKLDGWA